MSRRFGIRVGGAAALVAVLACALMASGSAAAASTVTLGQLASPNAPAGACSSCTDLQPGTETQSPTYSVPAGHWTLTSWSGQAGASKADVKLRVFRPTGVANQYRIVAESTMQTLNAKAKGTFEVQIPVQTGDFIGLETGPLGTYPVLASEKPKQFFTVALGAPPVGATLGPGGEFKTSTPEEHAGHLNIQATLTADTGTLEVLRSGAGTGTVTSTPAGIDCGVACIGTFELGTPITLIPAPAPGSEFAGWSICGGTGTCAFQLDAPTTVKAIFLPTNKFGFGKLIRNPKRGTARLALSLPSPGSLTLRGKGVKTVRMAVAKKGRAAVSIGARGRSLLALDKTGKTKLNVFVTFTPRGGKANTEHHRVTLLAPPQGP